MKYNDDNNYLPIPIQPTCFSCLERIQYVNNRSLNDFNHNSTTISVLSTKDVYKSFFFILYYCTQRLINC